MKQRYFKITLCVFFLNFIEAQCATDVELHTKGSRQYHIPPAPSTPPPLISNLTSRAPIRLHRSHASSSSASPSMQIAAPSATYQQKHLPMIMCIDRGDSELQISNPSGRYFVTLLGNLIQQDFKPFILASWSLIRGLVEASFQNTPEEKNPFPGYTLYDVRGTHFLLLIPNKYPKEIFFNWSNLDDTTKHPLLDGSLESAAAWNNWFDSIKDAKTSANTTNPKDDINAIFSFKAKKTKAPIWDFWIGGHGQKNDIIADLKTEYFADLLIAFNTRIKTGTVFVQTCYGGNNLTRIIKALRRETDDVIPKLANHLQYPFIMGSFTNSIASMDRTGEGLDVIKNYFVSAARGNKGTDLNRTLNALLNLRNSAWFGTHGSENICQVLLPNQERFRVLRHKEDPHTAIIGNVRLRSDNPDAFNFSDQTRALIFYVPKIAKTLRFGLFTSERKDDPASVQQRIDAAIESVKESTTSPDDAPIPSSIPALSQDESIDLEKLPNASIQSSGQATDLEQIMLDLALIKPERMAQFSKIPIRLLQLKDLPSVPRDILNILDGNVLLNNPTNLPYLHQILKTENIYDRCYNLCSQHYPEFFTQISAQINGEKEIFIKKIGLKSNNPLRGIYSFFIEAFLATAPTETTIFNIKELTGYNDLSIVLELIKNQMSFEKFSNFESLWNTDVPESLFQKITLQNLIIKQEEDFLTISFFLGTTEYRLEFKMLANHCWHFSNATASSLLLKDVCFLLNQRALAEDKERESKYLLPYFQSRCSDHCAALQPYLTLFKQYLSERDSSFDTALCFFIEKLINDSHEVLQDTGLDLLFGAYRISNSLPNAYVAAANHHLQQMIQLPHSCTTTEKLITIWAHLIKNNQLDPMHEDLILNCIKQVPYFKPPYQEEINQLLIPMISILESYLIEKKDEINFVTHILIYSIYSYRFWTNSERFQILGQLISTKNVDLQIIFNFLKNASDATINSSLSSSTKNLLELIKPLIDRVKTPTETKQLYDCLDAFLARESNENSIESSSETVFNYILANAQEFAQEYNTHLHDIHHPVADLFESKLNAITEPASTVN